MTRSASPKQRSKLLAGKAKKKTRTSRAEIALVNMKYMGEEPEFEEGHKLTEIELCTSLTWYNYMCDVADARDYLEEWLKDEKDAQSLKMIKVVPDKFIPRTAAWVARILSNGYVTPRDGKKFVMSRLSEVERFVEHDQPTPEQEPARVISIQDRIRSRAHELYGEVEDALIANDEKFSLYELLVARSVPAMIADRLAELLQPLLDEVREATGGKCPQLREAYRFLSRPQLKTRLSFLETAVEDCGRHSGNARKTFKPRIKKPQTAERQIKHLKYLKTSAEYKLQSIDPRKIVGASELWVFNVKYRMITVFRAVDRGGLKIKGTSITNFDDKTSATYTTGRRTEGLVSRVLSDGKMSIRKMCEELNKIDRIVDRIGENTILMRVI